MNDIETKLNEAKCVFFMTDFYILKAVSDILTLSRSWRRVEPIIPTNIIHSFAWNSMAAISNLCINNLWLYNTTVFL